VYLGQLFIEKGPSGYMNNYFLKSFTTMLVGYLFAFSPMVAQENATHVVTHDQVTIFTNPSKGRNNFTSWGVFPSESERIRRITMHVTLAHPADRPIAHWDYLDHIRIRRQGGVKGDSLNYEIGRMLTPYGSNFKKEWFYTWKVDVTDFSSFLRDSVEIEYMHTGYESPELGWDLTIDFQIDYGPPIANLIKAEVLWEGSFRYGDPEDDIEIHLAAKEIEKTGTSAFGRIRIQHTGHGMDNPKGCSDFCSRWRELLFDGEVIELRDMWKECGYNPLYPQGGSWIFDRAYWCPGDLQWPDIIDVPLTGERHTIDLNMEPFTANNVDQPRESIAAYFLQFSEPTHSHDVVIEEILVPNMLDNFNRYNPAGFHPQIRIRNLGKKNLRELDITYKTIGYRNSEFTWRGNLAFYEEAIITLPGEIKVTEGTHLFEVVLSNPNGRKDEWKRDNKLQSEFAGIPVIPSRIVVDFLTNNTPDDNSLYIVNSRNDTVFMKLPDMLEPATHYLDTLQLAEGSYNLVLTDSTGDGLEFWFQPESGYGRLRLKDIHGNFIHLFESDCGSGQFYSFRCDHEAVVDTTLPYLAVNIFPRMVNDFLNIYTTTEKPSTLKLRITKDGEYIEQHEYKGIRDDVTGLDVRHLEKGRYVMEIFVDGVHEMNRRFNKR